MGDMADWINDESTEDDSQERHEERRTCTECGKEGADLRRDDAGNNEHWFHPECLD
jgi:hypothetical protein